MPGIYFFLPRLYDYQQATLVEGFRDCGFDVIGSNTSNYCANARKVSSWHELAGFEFVVFSEGSRDEVARLAGTPAGHPGLIYVDGGDYSEIEIPARPRPAIVFKRELPGAVAAALKPLVHPLGFGLERRYVREFKPHAERRYDLSCMLRLDTNPFRKRLQDALQSLMKDRDVASFIGNTGEIAYSAETSMPLPTPKYAEVLTNSRISISCHGAGEDTARFWEILGSGCLLLSQRLTIAIPDAPQDGRHCVYFDNPDDFRDKLFHYLAHPEEAERIARAGYQHALEAHSARARAQYLVDTTQTHAGQAGLDFGKRLAIAGSNLKYHLARNRARWFG